MKITKTIESDKTILTVDGRLDTTTAPELAAAIAELDDGVKTLVLDFKDLEYVSSAGLRVILSTHKKLDAEGGKLVVAHPNDMIQSIFALTGFIEILNIED